ncbi:MAG: extracellular solute-binding protein [Lachnospiraceae bacterium]|nr:extracellular solute-binding protein [Lachnospiraceae bacterium]
MKKRSLALLLAAAMVTGLTACGGGGSETTAAETTKAAAAETTAAPAEGEKSDAPAEGEKSDAPAADGEEITLTVWHIAIDETRHQTVTNAMNRFMEKYPNVKVVDVPNENDPYKTKLATAMAAGEEPDIFVSWGGGWLESFIDEGKVLDIDDRVKEIADEYYPAALSLFQIKGKNYSLPYSCGPVPVYYNKQIYADLGLEVPTTIEEFEANCDKIKEAGIIPLALGNSSQWPAALTFTYLSMREGGTQPFLDAYNRENGGTFEHESFIKAGARLQDWVKKGYYPEGCNGINYDTGGSRMLFYNGMAAHIVQTNGMFSNCRSEAPEFYENNLGIFGFPVIEGTDGNAKQILGGGNAYSISASCEHPDEAFELIHMLTDKEFGQESVDIAGVISGVKGVTMPNELTKAADEFIQNAEYIQNFYDQFLPTDLGALHKQTTYDLVGLECTPEEAAAKMEELAKQTLDK